MQNPVSIVSLASLSALGAAGDMIWQSYVNQTPRFVRNGETWSAPLDAAAEQLIQSIAVEPRFRGVDRSVLLALAASRSAVLAAGWSEGDFGINIGSSRGATAQFEKFYSQFLNTGTVPVQTSPSTTLGNIATWVAQDLMATGPAISHSITCSTSMHAIINAVAWLNSGMAERFIAGGSEAPLTDFTIAQMRALKIYSQSTDEFPCRAMDFSKVRNTMILGEAAAIACLERGVKQGALGVIRGIGYATETLRSSTSISADAVCFQKSMQMALKDADVASVDAVVMHAPGTIAGDTAELEAIRKVFAKQPLLTGNKWLCGHTFGASGMLSVELACLMMKNNQFIEVPFLRQAQDRDIKTVLVNAVGFGGNAVSVLVTSA